MKFDRSMYVNNTFGSPQQRDNQILYFVCQGGTINE